MISKPTSAPVKQKPESKETPNDDSSLASESLDQTTTDEKALTSRETPATRGPATPGRSRRGWLRGLISTSLTLLMLVAGGYGIYLGRPYIEKWMERFKVAAKPDKPPPRPVTVVTAPAKRGNMRVFINGLGTITAYQTVTVRSRVEGQLTKVAFKEGQTVQEGDVLAEIDSRPFVARLHQAEGQLTKDEALVKGAKLTLARNQKLFGGGAVTAQQIDEQIALVGQAEGSVLADKAMIEDATLQITYSTILAPISGRIGLRLVDQGNMVRANDPSGLAVITQLQPITMTFTVPQDDIARVQARTQNGQRLTVEAYNRDFDMKLASGKLLAIDNQVDVTTGTVRLKAVFRNEDNMLFPNQFVNARLLVNEIEDAIIVPTAAIQHGPDFDFVYVVKDDDTVDLRTVKTGIAEGETSVVLTGLEDGQMVVTGGMDKLQRGSKIAKQDSKKLGAGDGTKQANDKTDHPAPKSREGKPGKQAPPFGIKPLEEPSTRTALTEADTPLPSDNKARGL